MKRKKKLSKPTQTDTVVSGGSDPNELTEAQLLRARLRQSWYEGYRWSRLVVGESASSRIPREAK